MDLKRILARAKLVELEEPSPAPSATPRPGRPPRPAETVQSIEDMLGGLPPTRPVDDQSLPASKTGATGEQPTFGDIYRAAGIAEPPHGFTAFKILEILSSSHLASLDPKARAAALMGFLSMNPSGPIALRDVIQDAVLRDQALDSYEAFLRKKLESTAQDLDQKNAQLQAEIDAILRRNREKMDANAQALEEQRRRFREWQAGKRDEERRLFDAVTPFVQDNPISLTEPAGSGTPTT